MDGANSTERQLLLLLVAYHTPAEECTRLLTCLSKLSPHIGYAVVVNRYQAGDPIDLLKQGADYFLTFSENLGYGRAANRLMAHVKNPPAYIGVLNTDLSWEPGTFECLLNWMQRNQDVCLAVPQIRNSDGSLAKLCKQHPTILALLSRRFWPDSLKPSWLKRYDRWFSMADHDYYDVFEVPYLSGCCMIIYAAAFQCVSGFDERFFLYLEDADITRRLSKVGRCVHLPIASVVHGWGRGNYRSLRLMAVNLGSAWLYFKKWKVKFW